MSAQMERVAADGMVVVDCDVHLNDLPQYLAPYCEMPWRKTLEILSNSPQRYLDIPGYSPALGLNPLCPVAIQPEVLRPRKRCATSSMHWASTTASCCRITYWAFAQLPNIEYATALSHAYNNWMVAKWLREGNGLYGAIRACPQNPEDSAKEIEPMPVRRALSPSTCPPPASTLSGAIAATIASWLPQRLQTFPSCCTA